MALPGRTTSDLVEGVIEVEDDIDLDPFIDAANYLVTRVCAVIPINGYTYTTAELKLIETWLAAHFYAVREARPQRERISRLTFEAQSKVDIGLSVTHYGQTAMRLDINGGLAAMDNAMKKQEKPLPAAKRTIVGGVRWAGTPACPIPSDS